ncbi:hypothetical protein FRB94_000633 [Tulasnella sp. JGI-2019a]|nr:hypothetical protein FRB94_000633 [Tulasnella sp. JGI-2019a]KAG9032883.1 hypothetical protein FRB95_000898 [Tulasnella sp. JGI-2019a]
MSTLYVQHQRAVGSTSALVPALNPAAAFRALKAPYVLDIDCPSSSLQSFEDQVDSDDEPMDRSVFAAYRDNLATRPVQAPSVQPSAIQVDQPSPLSLKRQRDEETTTPISSRAGSSTTHVRHHPTMSPSRQRATRSPTTTTAEAPTDEESSPPAKRTRTTTPEAASVPATSDASAHPAVVPSSPRRPSRHVARPGNTYAERQPKLANTSDAKKRADLKKKAKTATGARALSERPNTIVDGEGEDRGDLAEVAKPKSIVAAPKARKVATTTTTKCTAKAAEVKGSLKKAAVKTKTKTAANARTQTDSTSTSTEPRSKRTKSAPVPMVQVENNDAEGTAVGGGEGSGQAVKLRRSTRLRK